MTTEWKKVKLGETFTVKKGQAITKRESKEGPYPVILGGREPAYFIDRFNHKGKAIVVSRSGASAGYVSFWNEAIFITDGFLIEPNNDVCYEYIYYLMKNNQSRFIGSQKGAAIPHVTPALLSDIDILLPPLETQQKNAGILSAYDDLIENNRKQIKLLEEAAQKLYKEWFVKLNFPGHENAKIVDGVPVEWKKVRAEDYFEVTIGKTPPRNESKWFSKGSIGKKWISIADMGNSGVFIFQTSENLTNEAIESKNVKIIPENTVLLSFKLTVGRVSITTEEMTTNEAIAHFVTDNKFIREYIYLYLKNFHYDSLGSTSAISTAINSKIVKSMPIIIPPESLLDFFSKLAAPYFDKIKSLQNQIQLLQSARDKLLPRLMNGDINV